MNDSEIDNSNKSKLLLENNDFSFMRMRKNYYKLYFHIENKNLLLHKLINFDFLKLIFDLNSDIYEKVHLEKKSEYEAVAVLVMKNFFEDFGLPQRFTHVRVIKNIDKENLRISFHSQSIRDVRPEIVPPESELLDIQDMFIICDSETQHKIKFEINFQFANHINVPEFAEKIISMIINKIFKRVKLFIENITI
jgi:hypothetical protein